MAKETNGASIPKALTQDYIAESLVEAICVTGMNGEVLFLNAAAEKLFRTEGEKRSRKIWEVIPFVARNDDLIQLLINCVINKETRFAAEVDYENREGNVSRLHVSVKYMEEEQPAFLILINNLTELARTTAALTRYTSVEIADFILNTPEGARQGGRECQVSVLMSDLRGFTAMSGRMDSDQLLSMLNHYLEEMTAIIENRRGTVIEFLGDGIFVLFGAPKDNPNHAADAVICALEMQNAMDRVNAWNRQHGFPELSMGIGIHSGPATVGNIGSRFKMKYGCVGETVNIAGRIQSRTARGQVFISRETCGLIGEALTLGEEMTLVAKGKKEPIRLYEVTGIGSTKLGNRADGEIAFRTLGTPALMNFTLMTEKTAEDCRREGRLEKLSGDGKYAVLRPEEPLPLFADLRVNGEEMAYAKVIRREEDGAFLICFTWTAEGFDAWLKGLT